VFQFESPGMQRMLRDAKPSRIGDLIALVALYRPGPMDLIPTFVARKHGREPVEYPHPLVEPVLAETYGIMVYQEQVMQTAQVLGGYSLGGADMLRRAMGKKKAEEMAKHREIFREGAAKKNIGQQQADEIFDLMEKFAGYGFNKSHAAAYALLSYHTGWLKAHCPAEFYAANMTIEMGDTDKLRVLLADAKQFGIAFTPPDVNICVHRFEPAPGREGDKLIRYGLGAVKGTGQGAIEAIVAAREGGPFRSIFDFAKRVDRSRVNKRVVDALVKAGGFDLLHPDRASTLASVGLAFEWADAQAAHAQQSGLFDFGGADEHGASTQEPALVPAEPWSVRERLTLEKTAIGFYLSGHMFDQSESEVRKFCKRRIADLIDSREPQILAGIVSDLRIINGQRGRVAIFKVDDKTEAIEAVANEEMLDTYRDVLRDDELLIVQGKVQPDRFSGGLRLNVTQVWDLAAARARFGRYLSVQADGNVAALAELVRQWPARRSVSEHGESVQGLGVRVKVRVEGQASAELDLGDQGRFWPTDDALARWTQILPTQAPQVVYA